MRCGSETSPRHRSGSGALSALAAASAAASRLDGSRFVVKRRKPWRSDVVFYCATAPAARAWAEALRSRLDAFRNKARVQFPPLNESLGPNLSPRPELPPYPPPSPARLKAGQVDVAG